MKLIKGDCIPMLRALAENSVDALVTDPPAGIGFMNKEWDHHKGGRDEWVKWMTEVMRECHRVLKPGAHGLVWSIPRTSHWTGWALEQAGFEIRDCVYHLFGSGFPKSLDISKAIDKAAGAKRPVVGVAGKSGSKRNCMSGDFTGGSYAATEAATEAATDAAKQWNGWGTALKPAVENWWLVRKPLSEKTVAKNVLRWSTGALNIDSCRIRNDKTGSTKVGSQGKKREKHYCDCLPNLREEIQGVEQPIEGERLCNMQPPMSLEVENREEKPTLERGVDKAGRVQGNSSKWNCGVGTSAFDGKTIREKTDKARGCASQESQKSGQPHRKSGTCERCGKPYNETSLQTLPKDGEISQHQVTQGRFPSHIVFSHTLFCTDTECDPGCAVAMLDVQSGESRSTKLNTIQKPRENQSKGRERERERVDEGYSDRGGASRFFYCAKPSKRERNLGLNGDAKKVNDGRATPIDNAFQRGETERLNVHPTVKPVKLMRYLCRMITPPGGTVLDPFMGSGTTGMAAKSEKFKFVGIEAESEYLKIAKSRISAMEAV